MSDDWKPATDRDKQRLDVLNAIAEMLQSKFGGPLASAWRTDKTVYLNTSEACWRIECKASR